MSPLGRPARSETTPTITKPDLDEVRDVKPKALLPYKVVVLDCNCHTFDDVEIALCRVIPGMTRNKAHQHAWRIGRGPRSQGAGRAVPGAACRARPPRYYRAGLNRIG